MKFDIERVKKIVIEFDDNEKLIIDEDKITEMKQNFVFMQIVEMFKRMK